MWYLLGVKNPQNHTGPLFYKIIFFLILGVFFLISDEHPQYYLQESQIIDYRL